MDIVLLGAGGHAKDMIKNIEEYNDFMLSKEKRLNILGCVDDTGAGKKDGRLCDYPVLNSVNLLGRGNFKNARAICAVGDPAAKSVFIAKARRFGIKFFSFVHPSVKIPRTSRIGSGVSIFSSSIISAFCDIGDHVSINYQCSISHDCRIGDLVTISPGVKIGGCCVVREGAFLGINSCLSDKVRIGSWSVIGAGAVIVKNVSPRDIVVSACQRILGKRDKDIPVI